MATETVINRPAPFVEDIGKKLSEQALGLQNVPVVTTGIGGLTQGANETAEGFADRQNAARAFDIRKQNLAGLAPEVAPQDRLQLEAQKRAEVGLGSFEPFLQRAETEAQLASGLGTTALGQLGTAGTQLGTAGTTLGGVPLGAQSFQQDVSQFMSPYQQQVIDVSLAEFDRNKQMQEQQLRDQQAKLGALGSGRAGVQLSEFGTGAARERALLQAGLLQQGFQQAQGARQQDITNRFGLGQAQAGLDATREANRMATFQPQEQLDRYANQVTGLMGGVAGQGTQTTNIPNPTPLQTALGVGTTLAGIYGATRPGANTTFSLTGN